MHINELFSLKGKCAIVIGGAGKIGLPMSEALLEAGATVYIASRSKENYKTIIEKFKQKGLDAKGITLDQSNEKSVNKSIKIIKDDGHSPDILINCGYSRPMKNFFHDSVENWDKSMEVNARGIFITCRAFGNEMALSRGGSIINISSIYGMVAPNMNIYENLDFETEPDYPFIKGGIISFSKYLSSYYAKSNVRVNCVSPGGFFNNQPKLFIDNYTSKTLSGRMANHDDMKGVAVFLASEASSYITGSIITVDGGFTTI